MSPENPGRFNGHAAVVRSDGDPSERLLRVCSALGRQGRPYVRLIWSVS